MTLCTCEQLLQLELHFPWDINYLWCFEITGAWPIVFLDANRFGSLCISILFTNMYSNIHFYHLLSKYIQIFIRINFRVQIGSPHVSSHLRIIFATFWPKPLETNPSPCKQMTICENIYLCMWKYLACENIHLCMWKYLACCFSCSQVAPANCHMFRHETLKKITGNTSENKIETFKEGLL